MAKETHLDLQKEAKRWRQLQRYTYHQDINSRKIETNG
jgi:hypothetical protein